MTNRAILAKLHIAPKDLGYTDAVRRDIMARICNGKTSSKQLTLAESDALLKEYKRLGWKPKPARKKINYRKKSNRPLVRKVYALWGELREKGWTRNKRPDGFVNALTGAGAPEWCTNEQLNKVIEALKSKL